MKKHLFWLLPVLFLLFLAPFTPYLDLTISRLFYSPVTGFYNHPVLHFLFHYGEMFGLATGGLATLFFLLSFLRPQWQKWRQPTCAILLTLVIGAGLLTNMILKGYWGRPRPRQIEEFGGKHTYRAVWQPSFQTTHKSFPSGHVAMGFYFLSLAIVGKRLKKPSLFFAGLFFSFALGGSLMVTRVVQGGHFFSDVITSPILMWLVAIAVDKLTWGEWGRRALFLKPLDTSRELDAP